MLSQVNRMCVREVKREYISPFKNVEWFYNANDGFIAWRMGTGNNVELLHIRAWEQRKGMGRRLFYHMLESLEKSVETTPYYSVYGFTRVSNERGIAFYEALGFKTQTVPGVYADGESVLFSQSYIKLLAHMNYWKRWNT